MWYREIYTTATKPTCLKISINAPCLDSDEINAASSVIKDGQLTSASYAGGRHVKAFERAAASYIGTRYAIAVSSGTAALQAALHALDIGRGDDVLIPSFTFVATANAVASTGARPVFVDILGDSYTMDADDLEKKITKKTKAVIPVHLYGNVAQVDRISKLAAANNFHVIEDSAQSLGSTFRGRHTGTFSDMGCFSMYPSKVITSSEGGFVVTDNRNLRDRIMMFRNHGMASDSTPQSLGLNLRLPEINAAIARIQLRKLPRFLKARRCNAAYLTELLSSLDIDTPKQQRHAQANWYLYTIAITNRDKILKKLNKRGIGAASYYSIPVHRIPFYRKRIRLPVTDWAAAHVLSLPIHPQVSKKDIEYIAKSLHDVL